MANVRNVEGLQSKRYTEAREQCGLLLSLYDFRFAFRKRTKIDDNNDLHYIYVIYFFVSGLPTMRFGLRLSHLEQCLPHSQTRDQDSEEKPERCRQGQGGRPKLAHSKDHHARTKAALWISTGLCQIVNVGVAFWNYLWRQCSVIFQGIYSKWI